MTPHHHPGPIPEQAGTHNMLVVGHKHVYLSHLPMFHGEHAAQVILEAGLQQPASDVGAVYLKDRASHPDVKMYTLQPAQEFVLSELFEPDRAKPARTAFSAQALFRGHLERPGNKVLAEDFTATVLRVVHAHRLPVPTRPANLTYVLFGSSEELFAAHFITQPPDFDQVVGVKLEPPLTAQEVQQEMVLTITGRANKADARIRAGERVAGSLEVGANTAREVHLLADTEFYFEEGELRAEPTFSATRLEREGGF